MVELKIKLSARQAGKMYQQMLAMEEQNKALKEVVSMAIEQSDAACRNQIAPYNPAVISKLGKEALAQ